jgi:hypothetical protein
LKIKREWQEAMTIHEFAEKHDLTMVVFRKKQKSSKSYNLQHNYYVYGAYFEKCAIRDGCCLISRFGSGATEEEAIANYAALISDQTLVVTLGGEHLREREIDVPPLTTEKEKKV